MRRRLFSIVALIMLLAGYPAFLIARAKFFPEHYDVVSIEHLPEYQDPPLIERAWNLPVAAAYRHRLEPQRNVSVCGPTSAANVFRSLGTGPSTVATVLRGSGRCRLLGYCWNGLTLDELAEVVRKKAYGRVTVLRDLSLAEFRGHMMHANEVQSRYIVNFHRGLLFGKGGGHHSPIGGYIADRDLVFVLDVNSNYGPWLVKTERLYEGTNTVDADSKLKRGLLLLE